MPKKLVFAIACLVTAGASAALAQTYEQTWSSQLALIGVTPTLQDSAGLGAGVLAGVIDTGIAADHVDLAGRVAPASTCVIAGCPAALASDDDNGHGTHVAGIIGAARNG